MNSISAIGWKASQGGRCCTISYKDGQRTPDSHNRVATYHIECHEKSSVGLSPGIVGGIEDETVAGQIPILPFG